VQTNLFCWFTPSFDHSLGLFFSEILISTSFKNPLPAEDGEDSGGSSNLTSDSRSAENLCDRLRWLDRVATPLGLLSCWIGIGRVTGTDVIIFGENIGVFCSNYCNFLQKN
jgi:hypothetical protein